MFAPRASEQTDPFAGADLEEPCSVGVASEGDDDKENSGFGTTARADDVGVTAAAAASGAPPAAVGADDTTPTSAVLSLPPGVLTVSPYSVTMVTPRRGVRECV